MEWCVQRGLLTGEAGTDLCDDDLADGVCTSAGEGSAPLVFLD